MTNSGFKNDIFFEGLDSKGILKVLLNYDNGCCSIAIISIAVLLSCSFDQWYKKTGYLLILSIFGQCIGDIWTISGQIWYNI